MASWSLWSPLHHPGSLLSSLPLRLRFFTLFFFLVLFADAATSTISIRKPSLDYPIFREAPAFRNGESCASPGRDSSTIHMVMTLDANYLRGTMAAVLLILQHSMCHENFEFHFLCSRYKPEVFASINSAFPYLHFRVYWLDSNSVRGKISKSIQQALDQPLNYARIYLVDLIPMTVKRMIYLDSDLVVVVDIAELWDVDLENKVLAAPEYCHANFTKYFTNLFWSYPALARTFVGWRPCYFNTGLMVVNVDKWRVGGYTQKVEEWMLVHKQKRIYHLGSLPPFC